ncbi:hypothetical protein [Neorhizobium huautlense]|uniref:hypothetical protein n=1 Tax=Neorhizobium huautlense TaxID=67774 RepID=UPI000CF906BC|nr:hypothetical protein [Neorhizobium huautlense]
MPINEKPDRFGTAEGARLLAIDTVIRALVDHASLTDPALRKRTMTGVKDYIASLDPQSEAELDFSERAIGFAAKLVRPFGS